MRAQVAAGIEGSTVTTGAMRRAAFPVRARNRASLRTFWERLLQVIGRAVLGLPASTWLLLDVTILTAGVCIGYEIFPPPGQLATPHVALWQASAIFAFVVILSSLVFGLYERDTLRHRSRIMLRTALSAATATALAYAIIYVVMYATVSRRVSAFCMSTFLVGGVGMRMLAWWVVQRVHCGLLVVGTRALFDSFKDAQEGGLLREYELLGYTTPPHDSPPDSFDSDHLGGIDEQIKCLAGRGITDVVVGDSAARDPHVMEWMVPCFQHGCRVTNEAIFYEKATGQILVDQITPAWFLFADLKVHCDEHASLKRASDLVIASLGLLLTAPLWPLIGLAIKLCDGGSVFYSQNRVGQNGSVFRLHKFRTMRPNAENGKSIWCAPNDPRVTRVGRFLRRTRLDELPQLYNVLVGQMSIAGPRPERPDIVRELCEKVPYYAERHLVKPGITGWAQISFRYGASVEDAKRKLQFDLYYLKHMSLELDIIILFRTAGTFLRGAC